MNRTQAVERLATTLGTSKSQATLLLDAVLREIERGVNEDGCVTLVGFGTFEKRETRARVGRNPTTGQPVPIPAGKRVAFRSSTLLRKRLT